MRQETVCELGMFTMQPLHFDRFARIVAPSLLVMGWAGGVASLIGREGGVEGGGGQVPQLLRAEAWWSGRERWQRGGCGGEGKVRCHSRQSAQVGAVT